MSWDIHKMWIMDWILELAGGLSASSVVQAELCLLSGNQTCGTWAQSLDCFPKVPPRCGSFGNPGPTLWALGASGA